MSEAIKERRWEEYFSHYGRGIPMFRTREMNRLICHGIPNKLKCEMWMILSGAIHEKLASPGYYASTVNASLGSKTVANDEIGHVNHQLLQIMNWPLVDAALPSTFGYFDCQTVLDLLNSWSTFEIHVMLIFFFYF